MTKHEHHWRGYGQSDARLEKAIAVIVAYRCTEDHDAHVSDGVCHCHGCEAFYCFLENKHPDGDAA